MEIPKLLSVITVCVLVVLLAGCGSGETENRGNSASTNEDMPVQPAAQDETTGAETAETETEEPETAESETVKVESDTAGGLDAEHGKDGSSALVVYFSWSGNTENVANAIAGQTGADVFEIVPEEAYIDDYNALLDIAAEEKEKGARPAIVGSIDDISQYDIIYVGYPNWWSDMPMKFGAYKGIEVLKADCREALARRSGGQLVSHIAVEVPGEEKADEWCEPADDEAYGKLG